MLPNIKELQEILRQGARHELLPRFTGAVDAEHQHKRDGSIVTAADFAMQQFVQKALESRWPEYGFQSEEMGDLEQQLAHRSTAGFWCLDPLDGTSNFAAGIPFFAVSLALIIDDIIVLGVVYDPVRDECFTAQKGMGARLNDVLLLNHVNNRALGQCIAVVDFKRLAAPLATKLAVHPPYASQRNFGSVALEWCWLAAGRFQIYLHGQQKLWDYAAGSLILQEAGGHAVTLEGNKMGDGLQPSSAVAALDSVLFQEWKGWIQAGN